ncbi:MAG TPA: acyl-CoA dehydrogenase family protein [Kineosporiaceae bacterium]
MSGDDVTAGQAGGPEEPADLPPGQPEVEDFRQEVRAWLAERLPAQPLPPLDSAEGDLAHRAWERALFDAGLAVVSWPREYGGRGLSVSHWLAFEDEYHAAGAPARIGQNGLFLLAPTVFTHGTPEQCDRVLPRMARADDVWAQAWSEPDAGSDLAAIRSRARRTDGGWLVRGQKTWSSRAAFADRAFGLFRTDPDAERHRGLTYLLIDLRAAGVTVRPIAQLSGLPGFAEIFFDDVFVPDGDVLGPVDEGWSVAMSTAGHERGLSLRSPGRFTAAADRLVALWRDSPEPERTVLRDRVADAWIGARAYRMHTLAGIAAGPAPTGPAASLTKVFWSELDLAMHETAMELLGPGAEARGPWSEGYLFALAGPIYAGTNEIQRTVIAERLLGLPREPRHPGGPR